MTGHDAMLTEHVAMMCDLREESVHLTFRGMGLISLVVYMAIITTLTVYLVHGVGWASAILAAYVVCLVAEVVWFIRMSRLLRERASILRIMIEADVDRIVTGRD